MAFLCIQSCKKDCCNDPSNPDCKNYDPCYGKEPANASFHFYRDLSNEYGKYHYKTDTIEMYEGGSMTGVIFKVEDKNVDSCWWTVGQDTRVFTQKEFYLTFNLWNSPIPVKLIVDKHNAKNCNPDKPIRDTSTKILTLMPLGSSNIYGRYFGYLDGNKDDTATVQVLLEKLQSENIPVLRSSKLLGNINDESGRRNIWTGWNEFAISGYDLGTRPYFEGHAKLQGNELEIKFKYAGIDYPNGTFKNRTFNGIRQ
ncbi:MAG: hypothetical protein HUU47_01425 [Bacteroidetes bacterium]|nr:hypothetical protein [Bacteroidota bacterium]